MGLGISSLRLGLHARGAGWSPLSLFSGGAQGAWYDPSDLTSMYQGRTGTTAAAVDSPVGQLLDKSGNGNHMIAASDAARPTLRESGGLYYLDFDGSNDGMATSSTVDFSASDEITVCAGVLKEGSTLRGNIVELGNNEANTFLLDAPQALEGTAAPYRFVSRGSAIATASAAIGATQLYAPHLGVITGFGKISSDSVTLRINAVEIATSAADQGSGNFANKSINVGSRVGTTNFFDGRLFGLVVVSVIITGNGLAFTESWVAGKTGVAL